MKIKIRKDGFLELERAGKMKSQFCAVSRYTSRCGDWCPMFRSKKDELVLCCNSLIGEIIDERQKGGRDDK